MKKLHPSLKLGIGLIVLTVLAVGFAYRSDIANAVPHYLVEGHFWTALAQDVGGTIWFYIQEPGTWFCILLILMPAVVEHEFGHLVSARIFGLPVPVFSVGLFWWPRVFCKIFGTEFQVTPWLLGGYVSLDPASEDFTKLSAWKRAVILVGGVAMNFIMGVVILATFFVVKGEPIVANPHIVNVTEHAAQAGIAKGDVITKVNGVNIINGDLHGAVVAQCSGATPLQLTIERDGQTLTLAAAPDAACNIGGQFDHAIIGYRPLGIVDATYKATDEFAVHYVWGTISTVSSAVYTAVTPAPAVTSSQAVTPSSAGQQAQASSPFHGLFALFQLTVMAYHVSVYQLVQLALMIRASLFVMNLLPILPLDGGHLLFILIEKVRGKPVSKDAQHNFTISVGMTFIIAVGIFTLYNDLFHPILGK
jgi:regulator of sigma E protease